MSVRKVDMGAHLDMTAGAPLVCRTCGGTQTVEQTAYDPLMYVAASFDLRTVECDACRELSSTWAQECAVTRWEGEQR